MLRIYGLTLIAIFLLAIAPVVAAGSLTSVSLTPSSSQAGQSAAYTVSFTTSSGGNGSDIGLPKDGKILITFPAGFIVTGVSSAASSDGNLTGGFASASGAGNVVTLVRDGAGNDVAGDVAVAIQFQSVTNTTTAGSYQGSVETTTAGDVPIDSGASSNFSITSGALDHFTFNTISSPQTAGVAFSITITAKDQFNNTVTSFTSTASLSDNTGSISPTSTTAFTAGTWTGNVTITTSLAGNVITASASGKSGPSNSFTVNAAALDHFAFANISSPQTAGVAFSITITAKDQFNNTVTSFTSTASLSDNTGSISPTSTTAFTAGTWTGNVTITTSLAGNVITASASGKSGPSNSFTVNPAALDHFAFANISSPQTAGVAFSITITAKDQFNNTVTSFTSAASLSDNTGSISPVSTTAFTAGTWTGNVTITTSIAGNVITASASGKSGSSNSFTVNPAGLDHFTFAAISNQTAGVAFSITITAKDAFENTVTSFISTASLSDLTGSISPTSTTAFTAGAWTGNVTITNSLIGNAITATGSGKQGTSNAFNVNSGTLDHFTFALISSPQTAGVAFAITITAKDVLNNTVTSFIGTANLSDNTLSLSPTTTTAFTAGVWTGNVTITKSQAGVQITASSAGKQGQSTIFTVNPAALDHFSFALIANQTAGTPFSITVTAKDFYENTVSSFISTATLGDDSGTLSPVVTTAFAAGAWTGDVTITKSWTADHITANGGGKQGTSNAFDVVAVLDHFDFSTIPSPRTAGAAFSVTITAKDGFNNTVTSFTSTATLSDDTGTLSPTTTGNFVAGAWAGSLTITKSQSNVRITATASGKQGQSNLFTVNPAALQHFSFAAISTPQTAGVDFPISITAQDLYNNTVTSFSTTVTLSDPTNTISPTVSGPFVSGVWSDSVKITKSQTGITITATQGLATGSSGAFEVVAGPLDSFVFGSIASPQIAGVPFLVSITALDFYSNIATAFVDSATLSEPFGAISPTQIGGFVNGAWVGNVSLTKADSNVAITAASLGKTGVSNAFRVDHAALDHFSISLIDNQTAGSPFQISITAQDQYANTATSYTQTVTLQDESSTLTPTTSGAFSSGSWTGAVSITKSQQTSIIVGGGGKSGQSNSFFVGPAALNRFSIDPIGEQIAGVPFQITIRARDLYDNVVTGFASEVSLNDLTGSLLPRAIDGFQLGQWSGPVIVVQPIETNQIFAVRNGGSENGTSNSFALMPFLSILAVDASPAKVNQGQQGNLVNMVIENTGSTTISITSAGLTFTGPGNVNRTAQYVVSRNDTVSSIPPALTRTLTFSVNVSLSASLELITIDGNVSGMSNSQTIVDNDADSTDQWQVQSPAALSIASVTAGVDTVSRGQTGLLVTMRVANNGTADAQVTTIGLRFRLGAQDVTAFYIVAPPSGGIIPGGTNNNDFDIVVDVTSTTPLGLTVIDGVIFARDVNSSAVIADSSATTTESWQVNEAPIISFLSIVPSQATVTLQQARSWSITMTVQNNGGSDVQLDNTSISLIIGSDVTAQYNIINPTVFLNSNSAILAGNGAQDQLRFTITSAGPANVTTGLASIQGHLELTDLGTNTGIDRSSPIGLGTVRMQSPAQVIINSIIPSKARVNRRQTQDWTVTVSLTNTGQSDVRIDTVAAATRISFSLANDFVVLQPTFTGDPGFVLRGNSTANLIYTVDLSSDQLGENVLSAVVTWDEINSGRRVVTSGQGQSVIVETPAQLRIEQTQASSSDVFVGTDFQINVTMKNLGQELARNISVELTSDGISTFASPLSVTSLAGNQSTVVVRFDVRANAVASFQETFTANILQGTGDNTTAPVAILAALDSLAVVNIESNLLNSSTSILSPAGAQDSVVSTGQTFTLATQVAYDEIQIHDVRATLALPEGYTTSGSLTKTVSTSGEILNWNIIAPLIANLNPSDISIQTEGKNAAEQTITPSPDVVSMRTVERAQLRVVSHVSNPPGTRTVLIGQLFELQAELENDGAAAVTGAGTVRLKFESNAFTTSDALAQSFTVGAPATWHIQAPAQATLATRIYCILESLPNDENTNNIAVAIVDTSVIWVSTIADTSLTFSNYPNPFGSPARPVTNLYYNLPSDSDVQIRIYSLLGEMVWERTYKATDAQGKKGVHENLTWDAQNGDGVQVLNGVYVAQITTSDGQQATRKIAVLK